jgi:hypothetical protein
VNFKDHVARDIGKVFFNVDEFSDSVIIDGHEKVVQIDDDQLKDRGDKEYGGITTGMILYFIPVANYAPIDSPKVGNSQVFNKKMYYIEDVKGESSGVYEILLNQNRGE